MMATYLRNTVLLLSLALLATLSVGAKEEEAVLTLGVTTFDEEVEENDVTLVEFYAPWCGHCKSLAPEYEKAAKILKAEGSKIVLAKVDADNKVNKPLAGRFDIQGFPSLKVFLKGGKHYDFDGPRTADGLVAAIKKWAEPASKELVTADDVAAFLKDTKLAFVGVFPEFGTKEHELYLSIAGANRTDYVWAHTKDASILPAVTSGSVEGAFIRVIKEYDGGNLDIKIVDDVNALNSELEEKTIPPVVEMSQDPANRALLTKVFSSDKPKAFLFLDYKRTDKSGLEKAWTEVAQAHKADLVFIIGHTEENTHALDYFGVKSESTPALCIHDQASDKKFSKPEAQPADFAQFIQDFKSGVLKTELKSEPIPVDDEDEPVKTVVGLNFEEIVMRSGKNVLLEFYAPWCGHCKSLAPVFEEVGTYFEDDKDVIIAKIDATANDFPKEYFDVKGFPTIFFLTPKEGLLGAKLYEGGRTAQDFISYVKTHRTETRPPGKTAEEIAEEEELAHLAALNIPEGGLPVSGGAKDEL
eukprot:TRINITY_DN485_c0_g1_i1.p1 TRINITY_DN485_c0_g1~~TRINITY_DN485_c0_g1_i1.p1  ORF type:complete len:528 (-),score=151.28 TRINITY_DN485_c0_g1_i1:304-1887(-)